jgi:hypothetical protein
MIVEEILPQRKMGENPREDPPHHNELLRGSSKLIGGDLDVDDEVSEWNVKPLQSLHHCSVGYQSVRHELTSPRRLIPASAIENTSKNKGDAI